jgi:hypothetical protein
VGCYIALHVFMMGSAVQVKDFGFSFVSRRNRSRPLMRSPTGARIRSKAGPRLITRLIRPMICLYRKPSIPLLERESDDLRLVKAVVRFSNYEDRMKRMWEYYAK